MRQLKVWIGALIFMCALFVITPVAHAEDAPENEVVWEEDGWYYYEKRLGVADANGIARTLGKSVGWVYTDGIWYYYSGGEKVTGWNYIDGTYYYMNAEGEMQTGWQVVNGKWYFMNASGAMQTGWKVIDEKWYYLDESGAMQTGWLRYGEYWYYLDRSGVMQTGWHTVNGTKYLFAGDGKMIEGAKAFVIDVSKWQGTIAWEKVKASGVDAAIVRCGHGDELTEKDGKWKDTKFGENIDSLNRLGIPYGIYHYNTAVSVEQARTQAKSMIALIQGVNASPSLPVFVDIEQDAGECDLVAIAQVYMEEIIAAGYKPGIYANYNYWRNYLNAPVLNAYYRWIASYGVNDGNVSSAFLPEDGFENYMMWQYTSKGIVDGITENTVDCNVLFQWHEKTNGWKKVDNQWFYYDGGYLANGWRVVNGAWYYFAKHGIMQTGWQVVDEKWYYLNMNGAMQTGWQYVDGKWYYMDSSGAMQTGWQYINGYWYYLNESGEMVTGEQTIDGRIYHFSSNGVWVG